MVSWGGGRWGCRGGVGEWRMGMGMMGMGMWGRDGEGWWS